LYLFVPGAVYTATGSYNYSFWLGGVMFALGAGCHLVLHLPCIKKTSKGNNAGEIIIAEEEGKSMMKDSEDEV
jgi:hypothetical protein